MTAMHEELNVLNGMKHGHKKNNNKQYIISVAANLLVICNTGHKKK